MGKGRNRDSKGYIIDSECEFHSCDKPQLARGLCNGHYKQLRRGVPLTPLGTTDIGRRQRYALKHFLS